MDLATSTFASRLISLNNEEHLAGYTSGAAKRTIRRSTSRLAIEAFLTHRSPGVRFVATARLSALGAPAAVKVGDIFSRKDSGEIVEVIAVSEGFVTVDTAGKNLPDFSALATEYGEPDAALLPALFEAKGSDLAALKRSLSARRAARGRKAKLLAQVGEAN